MTTKADRQADRRLDALEAQRRELSLIETELSLERIAELYAREPNAWGIQYRSTLLASVAHLRTVARRDPARWGALLADAERYAAEAYEEDSAWQREELRRHRETQEG